ncbi:MAG: asparagine synthase (glutamine-hydrolyzing) [Bacteroidetes bacterium GWF2_38_335]|nr:MAG: asparagine synthase (glutamine-hydrolyzing) [Bacteroidetes bacterium GWF2_38_335]OFY79526.1 MAG: asparagine synthase (glutamine-hydrolyzing) [Bacteroidetes bacterium RIFOXYA12_FULL_38_20]HBS86609.1 asparagine synthase (glutamine-hydrolyzing) [Bacteroidales bacterium]
MCGITGIYSFTEKATAFKSKLEKSVEKLALRGPDGSGTYLDNYVALGHTRLAVIDTSDAGSQPFTDETGRYTIVFNGEFYNYRETRKELESKGHNFRSQCDTEVLLKLYIEVGEKCLDVINGCFSFAIYDKNENSLFLARDRFGINPLLYFHGKEFFAFSSEMKGLMELGIPKEIDTDALLVYFQFNYIPPPKTIFKNVFKISPGHSITIKNGQVTCKQYYRPQYSKGNYIDKSITEIQEMLVSELDKAVQRRLVADVPIGAFLSGGIDSSVIVALASRHTKNLNTFSIGFKDEPFFDETRYANLIAEKYKTNHSVFSLSNDDLYKELFNVLDYTDEPFADSSALAVYILSKHTRKKATVALSGDGADEVFAGYYKHHAHLMASKDSFINYLIRFSSPFLSLLPESRNSNLLNKFRQIKRYKEGLVLDEKERYWLWCSLMNEKNAMRLLSINLSDEYKVQKQELLSDISGKNDFNDILFSDVKMVLPGDMLTKTDLMSMGNSLEVRTPFLDHNVVNLAFSLHSSLKIDSGQKKKILQNSFRSMLPEELYNRPKQGFEVPLLKWMRNELKPLIENDLLKNDFIRAQNIFNPEIIEKYKKKLYSGNPGDVHANIWALIVFQYWWKKNMG